MENCKRRLVVSFKIEDDQGSWDIGRKPNKVL
jgi:hypothetical protein